MGSEALSEREEVHFAKQVEKKKMITPFKILIGVAIFCIVAMFSYKLYSLAYVGAAASKISSSHGKFIQHGDSSNGQETGSQTGSSSNKGSKSSGKPIEASQPISKGMFGPSPTGSGGDGEEPSEEDDNDGEKRSKKLKDNIMFDGTSTEGSSEEISEEDEDSEEVEQQGMLWPGSNRNNVPLVGSTRP